ncbi:MAG: hypothetical protein Q9220_000780 [cf. Caloplaca sp. 1 TL-2023]
MGQLSFFAAATAIISLASAFCVDFNSADHCTGSVVGKFIGTTGSSCQTSFTKSNSSQSVPAPGGANNVVINPEASDKKTGVAFFGNNDCEVLIGFGNVPLCTGVGAWASFKVISMDEADDQLTNLDPAPILSIQPNATAVASGTLLVPSGESMSVASANSASSGGHTNTAASNTQSAAGYTDTASDTASTGGSTNTATAKPYTGSVMSTGVASTTSDSSPTGTATAVSYRKRTAEERDLVKRVAHGSVQEHHGRQYKYHQIARRAWRGVPIEQWNEQLHKRDTSDWIDVPEKRHERIARQYPRAIGPVGGDSPKAVSRHISSRRLSPLEKRGIPPSKCNLVRTCMIDSGDNDHFGVKDAGTALLSAVQKFNGIAGDSWQFLEQPFVVLVTDSSNSPLGYIYAQTRQEHNDVKLCSDTGSEADALESALEMGVAGSTVSDMRIDVKALTGTGVTNTLFVSTRKMGNADMRIHPICEAIQLFD